MIPLFVAAHAADPVLDALAAELARTPELALPNEAPPYFVAYRLLDVDHVSVEATLGGVVSERASPDRDLGVQVRVGSPAEDNTNFRHGTDATGLSSTSLVIGDSGSAVRQQAWLATDREYKNAVENLARKRSARRNQPPRDRPPDFAPGAPHTAEAPGAAGPDPTALRSLAVSLSARFLDHPAIEWSRVWIASETGRRASLDTGGTRVVGPVSELDLRVVACARGEDGEEACDHVTRVATRFADLPPEAELAAEVDALAARLEAWRVTPRIEDEWVGPVVFEGDAAVELARWLLVPALVGGAPTETANSDYSRIDVGEGGLRLKRRVLPEGYGATDDPSAEPGLPSSYAYDDEGVPGARVTLVEDGLVRDLLMSRLPGEDRAESNGHGRSLLGRSLRAVPSNLRVVAARERPENKLFALAFALAKPYELDHVLVVRRLADPSIGHSDFRRSFAASKDERTDLPAPVEVVRRYADGREEPVRGLAFHNVDRRLLRDVVAAGPSATRTLLYGGTGGPTSGTPITITAPSMLVSEVELVPMEGSASRPPRVPSPLVR